MRNIVPCRLQVKRNRIAPVLQVFCKNEKNTKIYIIVIVIIIVISRRQLLLCSVPVRWTVRLTAIESVSRRPDRRATTAI